MHCQEEHAEPIKSHVNGDDDDDIQVSEEDNDDQVGNSCFYFLANPIFDCRSTLLDFYRSNKFYIKVGLLVFLVVLYFAYFSYALYYEFGDEGSIRLLWITCLVVVCLALSLLFRYLRPKFDSISESTAIRYIRQHYRRINWLVALAYKSIQLLYVQNDVSLDKGNIKKMFLSHRLQHPAASDTILYI